MCACVCACVCVCVKVCVYVIENAMPTHDKPLCKLELGVLFWGWVAGGGGDLCVSK